MGFFECYTVEILNEESSVNCGAYLNYNQAKEYFEKYKSKVGDSFHSESYGIAIIGWRDGQPCTLDEWQKPKPKPMKKFIVTGMYTEIIYAEDRDEALEKFDEITSDFAQNSFDEVEIKEMPID